MKIRLHNGRTEKAIAVSAACFAAVTAVLMLSSFLFFRFKPVFEEKAKCAAKNKANMILNNAVSDAFCGVNTDNFVNIITGEGNCVTSVNTNTGELNGIKTKIYENLKKYASNSENVTVYIPIGSLTEYPALQGVGYKIPVKVLFDTTLGIEFSGQLKEAGINQVYYEISVVASVNFDVVSALVVSETSVTSWIPVSQTLIVGTVPSSYRYDIARR